MNHIIYAQSIDDYGKGRTFKYKFLSNARKKWRELFGGDFERGGSYYTSYDGISIATISVEPYDKVNSLKAEELITGRKPFADWG
jgi:hypothetical protein